MSTKTLLYRLLSLSNDLKAISKGPQAMGKRYVRKQAYKSTTRLLRKFGL